ncbi:hypothetical protein H1S01_19825 [Heliobacterium chlorum]|uniref:Uncharacterized protein n=1 Tax=Heliobacterium chlorum TaxID=2698 RepID=A0ABR7T7F1_HELCL|nr:hypothetical protein [Heliobacterium chlorum]MBC9786694.1 hypothetical protein [Heliobacterium chlorum]
MGRENFIRAEDISTNILVAIASIIVWTFFIGYLLTFVTWDSTLNRVQFVKNIDGKVIVNPKTTIEGVDLIIGLVWHVLNPRKWIRDADIHRANKLFFGFIGFIIFVILVVIYLDVRVEH